MTFLCDFQGKAAGITGEVIGEGFEPDSRPPGDRGCGGISPKHSILFRLDSFTCLEDRMAVTDEAPDAQDHIIVSGPDQDRLPGLSGPLADANAQYLRPPQVICHGMLKWILSAPHRIILVNSLVLGKLGISGCQSQQVLPGFRESWRSVIEVRYRFTGEQGPS